jgi:hypothetical protein
MPTSLTPPGKCGVNIMTALSDAVSSSSVMPRWTRLASGSRGGYPSSAASACAISANPLRPAAAVSVAAVTAVRGHHRSRVRRAHLAQGPRPRPAR